MNLLMNFLPKLIHLWTRFVLILKHRRTRFALLALSLGFLLLFGLGALILRQFQLKGILSWAGQQSGHRFEMGVAKLPDLRTLELRNVVIGDFARIDFLEIKWTYSGLLSREVEELRVHGVQLFLSKLSKAEEEEQPKKPNSYSLPFTFKKLILGQATLFLDNLGAGLPPLPVRVGEVTPLVFNNLKLGGSDTDPAANDLQIVILDDLKFYSPYDAFSPVISFEQIRLGFSWNGIQNQQLDQLIISKPVIFVGDDLFLFVDQIKARKTLPTASTTVTPTKPWSITNFEVINGQIVLTTFSRPGITLPFLFSSKPQSVVLDDFSKMQFATQFVIEKTNLNYPDYGIKVQGMEGTLAFSLPLTEQNVTNIVPTLKAQSIEWKGLKMEEAWVGLTFDRRGLFGEFGGKTFSGYTKGNATVYLKEGYPWIGSAVVTKVEVEPITRLLSPENFLLNGPVSLSFKVEGQAKEVLKLTGSAQLDGPGVMRIPAINEVLAKLPKEWTLTKKDLAEIALSAFQRYDYNSGFCEVSFAPPQSLFQLRLDGKQGLRNIELKWNDKRTKPGLTY